LLDGPVGRAYFEIEDMPEGSGQGHYYFVEYDTKYGTEGAASADAILAELTGGGGGGGSTISMTTEYIHADHLGSTRFVTDEMGVELASYKYYPFGHYAQTSSGSDVRMKFTGHERDEGLMLDYMLARYYGASLGRFLSVDPIGVEDRLKMPQELNLYSYVSNNPLGYVDPTGEDANDLANAIDNKAAAASGFYDNFRDGVAKANDGSFGGVAKDAVGTTVADIGKPLASAGKGLAGDRRAGNVDSQRMHAGA